MTNFFAITWSLITILMPLQLCRASQKDAVAIAHVKDALWPEEATAPDYIAEVLQQPDHHTILAIYEGQVVGFVDGFLSLSASGQRRWEVDLLGVEPAYWGQGIGTQLVEAATQAGQEMKAEIARGLVATANIGSQRAFMKAGYRVEERPLNLWVWARDSNQASITSKQLSPSSYLIPVVTFNYQGTWLEGEISVASMQAAQAICARLGWAVTGTLIDIEEHVLNEATQALGYFFVNQFQWWHCAL